LTLKQVRAFNDGFQPWYSNRKRFSLRASAMTTLPAIRSEEGLAAINTIMNSRVRYLWLPALQYCKFFLGLSNIFLLFIMFWVFVQLIPELGSYLPESRISVDQSGARFS